MIEVKNLVKEYGNRDIVQQVLKNVSFTIKNSEFVSIIGPSGAGKSTLLYQMSLLDEPSSGEIIIDGQNTIDLNNYQKTQIRLKDLGYVFQDYALLPELTAEENVVLPLLMAGLSLAESKNLADLALDRIGLKDKHDSLPSQLSGGQQQRVSIARAIGHNPKILFADEPTANLDSTNSKLVMETFLDLHRQGQTIIMVTHEMEYAKLSQRTIQLKDGIIEQDFTH